MLIEEKADGMHQNEAQQAITQMPQIACPDPLHLTPIRQLTKDGVDEIANSSQDRTLIGCCLWRVRFGEWCLQDDVLGSQKGFLKPQAICDREKRLHDGLNIPVTDVWTVIMKILIGTRNMAKFDFYKHAIEQIGGLTCISLNELSNIRISEVVETGNTAQENASLKAQVYSAASGLPTISIDEALYIDALSEQEQPGTHVRRYQSDRPLTDEEMIDRFIRKTHHILPQERTITWLFAICLALPTSSDIFMETVQIREMLMDSPKLPLIKGYPLSSLVYNSDFGKPRSEFTDKDITEFNQPICEKLRSLIQKGIK